MPHGWAERVRRDRGRSGPRAGLRRRHDVRAVDAEPAEQHAADDVFHGALGELAQSDEGLGDSLHVLALRGTNADCVDDVEDGRQSVSEDVALVVGQHVVPASMRLRGGGMSGVVGRRVRAAR